MKLTGITAANGELRFGFNSVLGRNYALEAEGNLDNSWRTLATNLAGTGTAAQTVSVGAPNLPRQFFRVRLLP